MKQEALTIEDFITKTPEEIIPTLTVDDHKEKLKNIKKLLKDCFKNNQDAIKLGTEIVIDAENLFISRVLPSTGRVFFDWDGKEFSLSRSYLTGEEVEIPFCVGDEVVTKRNEVGVVVKIIKSSNKVVIKTDNNEEIYSSIKDTSKLEKD